jgi:hypothetical protein
VSDHVPMSMAKPVPVIKITMQGTPHPPTGLLTDLIQNHSDAAAERVERVQRQVEAVMDANDAELQQRIDEAHARQVDAERAQERAREAVYVAEHEVAMYVEELLTERGDPSVRVLELNRRSVNARKAREILEEANELARNARDAHAAAQDTEQLTLSLRKPA